MLQILCSECLRGGLGKSVLGFVLVCQLGVEDFGSSAAGPAAAPGPRQTGHHATFLAKVGRPVVSQEFQKACPEVIGPLHGL